MKERPVITKPAFYGFPDILQRLNRSKSWVWRHLKEDPDFPTPVRLGNALAWPVDEFEAYLKSLPRFEFDGIPAVVLREDSKVGRPRKAVA